MTRDRWIERGGRAGHVAKGVSFGLVAVLAILVALGQGGKTTDRQGAPGTLADEPFGELALIVLAIGFAGYALWRLPGPGPGWGGGGGHAAGGPGAGGGA